MFSRLQEAGSGAFFFLSVTQLSNPSRADSSKKYRIQLEVSAENSLCCLISGDSEYLFTGNFGKLKIMAKIKCPHCGYLQEPYRHVILCEKCYANIKEIIDEHFKGKVEEEPPKELKSHILKWGWNAFDKPSREAPWRLSGPLVILKRTFETSFKRFSTLYPLIFLSFLFFMLIGIFTSRIGAHIVYKMSEVRPPDDFHDVNASMAGVVACLFISFYGQAAFLFAVSNERFGMRAALAKAWRRLGSYIVLMLIMAVLIGAMAALVGAAFPLFLIPAVMVGVSLAFTPFVFAAEDAGLIESFSKSAQYVSSSEAFKVFKISVVIRSWLQVFFRLAPVSLAVILMTYFFAYGGMALLSATENVYAFVFMISAFMSLPILFLTVFIFKIYEDVRTAKGFAPAVEITPPSSPEEVRAIPVSTGLSSFEELLSRSWELYARRFIPLSILNLISYLPHVIHILILVTGYFGLKIFFEAFSIEGDYGLFAFLVLPKEILAFLAVGVLVFFLLYVLSAILNVGLYLALELAFVYAIADETISAVEALRKASKRVGRYFRTSLYRDFVVSTGFMLFIPGVAFWVWYSFTPYVFALEKEDQTPLASLWKSREYVRGLWSTMFKKLISLQFLPLVVAAVFFLFIFAALPFYWISALFLSFFSGFHLPGMLTIYSGSFWSFMSFAFYILTGGFYLPFQKVFVYLVYKELKDLKADDSVGS